MEQGAWQDFGFKAGFLPRASPWFCNDTDRMNVLLQHDGVGGLSFTSADCTTQDGEQRLSPRRDYRKEDRMVRGGFRRQNVTAITWQSTEIGWSHRALGRREVCVSPLTHMCYLLCWAGLFFQPSMQVVLPAAVRTGLEAALLPLPNHALPPVWGVAEVVQAAVTFQSPDFWMPQQPPTPSTSFAITKIFYSQIVYFIPEWF